MELSTILERATSELLCGLRDGYDAVMFPNPWRKIHEKDGFVYASFYVDEDGWVIGEPTEGCVRRDFRISIEEVRS